MPVGQHISTVQSLQNPKCLPGQHHTPSACELGHVRHTPHVLALTATQSHAAAAHSSHPGHCQPPSESWETHFIIIYNRNMKGCKSVSIHSSTEWVQNLPVTGNEHRKQLEMVQYGIQILVPSSYKWKKVGYAVGHKANPLAQALQNSQCHRFCRRRYPMGVQYSWERSQILLWISLNLICFTVMLLFLQHNGHFISIQTVQHSTNDDRKIHLFTIRLLFCFNTGDKPEKTTTHTWFLSFVSFIHFTEGKAWLFLGGKQPGRASLRIMHDGLDVVPREEPRHSIHNALVPAIVVLLDDINDGSFLKRQLVFLVFCIIINCHN